MSALEQQSGAPTSRPEFERKARMLTYVFHRAVFELWMTPPVWLSTH